MAQKHLVKIKSEKTGHIRYTRRNKKTVEKKLEVKKSHQLVKSPENIQTAQIAKNQILNFSKTSKSPYMAMLVFLPIFFGLNFITAS